MRVLILPLSLALAGCGASVHIAEAENTDAATPEVGGTDAVVPPASGEIGAPCKNDNECTSKLCLDIGRCSAPCKTATACPNSTNWSCAVVPLHGPMCVCEVKSMSDIACNGVDDNCDGSIDEGSPVCGGKCVDPKSDPNHCGACGVVCEGGRFCSDGKCTCPPERATTCGTQCVDLKSDVANCGACGVACAAGETCLAGLCKKPTAVDVTILLDVTGSNHAQLDAAIPAINKTLVAGLFKLSDVHVGVSYTCDFPTSPYGQMGDQPFRGGVEPIAVEGTVTSQILSWPRQSGGDESDGMNEALGTLAGLGVHPNSAALTCSTGRVSGGCFRPDSKRVIVLVTDDIFHNGPDPAVMGDALYDAYTAVTPAPHVWPNVRKALLDNKIMVLFVNTNTMGASSKGEAQYARILKDLGQPSTDVFRATTSTLAVTAAEDVLKRITAIKGP